MSLTVDGIWKAGVWASTAWADGVWQEGSAPVVVPAATTGGGSSSKKKGRKYPRRAMIRGILYTVNSLDEELQLLQAALDRAEYQDAVSVEPETIKPVQAIRKRIKKVESERQKWLAKLRAADEEILLLFH